MKVIVKPLKATTLRVGTMPWHVPQHIERGGYPSNPRGRRGANTVVVARTPDARKCCNNAPVNPITAGHANLVNDKKLTP